MTLPNKITISRFALTLVVFVFLLWKTVPYNTLIATIMFFIAMMTDLLDGYIARKFHLITKLGTFLDPLADKLIILLLMIFLHDYAVYPLWLILLFVAREMIVDAFRGFAISQSIYVGAIKLGKAKTFLQTISVIAGLFYLAGVQNQLFGIPIDGSFLKSAAFYVMLIAFIVSITGAVVLFKKNLLVLHHEK